MIKGIGSDLIRIERLRRPLGKPHFVERVFTGAERALLAASGDPVTFAAGRWAAKEAVAKALGGGFAGCPPGAISVERGDRGEPVVRFVGASPLAPGDRVLVTLTHEGDYAADFAVVEGGNP